MTRFETIVVKIPKRDKEVLRLIAEIRDTSVSDLIRSALPDLIQRLLSDTIDYLEMSEKLKEFQEQSGASEDSG